MNEIDSRREDYEPWRPLLDNIKRFQEHIDGLANTYPGFIGGMFKLHEKAEDEFDEFLKECKKVDEGAEDKDGDDAVTVEIPVKKLTRFKKLNRRVTDFSVATRIVPESFVITLVSQYDVFVGHLVRHLVRTVPNVLIKSDRHIAIEKLMDFRDIDEAKTHVIEELVEATLRKSHADQFRYFEDKLNRPLRKDLAVWPHFIELTERRNLFVHADGVVSQSYLSNCKNHLARLSTDTKVGDRLHVDPEYFQKAYATVLEVGVKLGQVIWRKLHPDAIQRADGHLTEVCLDLIRSRRYELAIEMIQFRLNLPNEFDSATKLIYQINLAQSYKWKGDPEFCQQVLSDVDWSAVSESFQLARAVLEDRYDDAGSLMRRIGKGDKNLFVGYQDWPLFREFRQNKEFLSAYEDVFGSPFITVDDGKVGSKPKGAPKANGQASNDTG